MPFSYRSCFVRANGLTLAAGALVVSTLLGCGANSESTGELGRLRYSLYTRYLSPDSELINVPIVTGYDQRINTELTSTGRNEVDNPKAISHRVEPAIGTTVTALADGQDAPDKFLRVTTPGPYTLASYNADQLFDRVDLTFDTPTNIELITWLRQTDGTFSRQEESSSYAVVECAQITFLPVPTNSADERLLGDIDFDVVVEPSTAAVMVHNVEAVYEQSVLYEESPLSLVFVQSGTVTVTVSDQVHNDVSTMVQFEVAAISDM